MYFVRARLLVQTALNTLEKQLSLFFCSSMEASLQTPSIESFSYSWLANLKPSDSLIASDHHDEGASFIEMDPRLPASKRFIRVSSDFGFDFPVSDSPLGLVHADELISNGFLVPLFVKEVKMERFDEEGCYIATTTASTSEITVHTTRRVRCSSLRRCHRLSKRFFNKYVMFLLRPLLYRRRRESSSSMAISSNRNWELSAATSPRTSLAFSADDNWRRSCDSESSIYEAVLHCKRTQGM